MLSLALLFVFAVAVCVMYWRMLRRLERATASREVVVHKQGKALVRRSAQSEARADAQAEKCERLMGRTQEMHEDARLLHGRVDALLKEVNDRGR